MSLFATCIVYLSQFIVCSLLSVYITYIYICIFIFDIYIYICLHLSERVNTYESNPMYVNIHTAIKADSDSDSEEHSGSIGTSSR